MYELIVPSPSSQITYAVKNAFPNLSFDHPVGLYSPNDGSNRLFVVGQKGIIYCFENNPNVKSLNIFLNITEKVHRGSFLGLAFHPMYAINGRFYVYYLAENPLRSVVAQYLVSNVNAQEANRSSESIILQIPQQYDSHSGGQLAFGPDSDLYIGVGDGMPYGDLAGNAQNCSSLLGKILRIDVDHTSNKNLYSIPTDNPFFGNTQGYGEEIFAWGFRNPWRFSFDPKTGLLFAGDVGQDRMEEIDIVRKGHNYGWNIMEGTLCYSPLSNCNQSGLEQPIWEYDHYIGNSTIGGFVYRGTEFSRLYGSYICGDYVSGTVWSLSQLNSTINARELLRSNLMITSFGIDANNELFMCAQDGNVYKLFKG